MGSTASPAPIAPGPITPIVDAAVDVLAGLVGQRAQATIAEHQVLFGTITSYQIDASRARVATVQLAVPQPNGQTLSFWVDAETVAILEA